MKRVLAVVLLLSTVPVQAATFATQATLCQDGAFVARVQAAIVTAAIDIASESDGTSNHVARAQYAYAVLHNPPGHATKMCPGMVAGNPGSIESNASDTNLYDRAAAVWTSYSMVDP
jgi:hypothetical protein